MFGIGAPEFFAIVVIAIVVLGPDRVPVAFRAMGRAVRRLRAMTREFRAEFAEEFQFLYEEVDVLRKEAADTRAELQEIRRELSETVQETTSELTSVGEELGNEVKGVASDVQGAVSVEGLEQGIRAAAVDGPASPPAPAVAPAAAASPTAPAFKPEPLGPADAMALAIAETFGSNGAPDTSVRSLPAFDAVPPAAAPDPPSPVEQLVASRARLSAFAADPPDPPETVAAPAAPASPPPIPVSQASEPPYAPLSAAGIGAASEPGLHNQLGGFVRLMVMRQLEQDQAFRSEAERTLRAQAHLDADRAAEIEDAGLSDIADAWIAQRRQLVRHGTVVRQPSKDGSGVIELFECPYRLGPGDAHPVCDVSNVYDVEYFQRLGVEASYAQRMSDGAPHCQLKIALTAKSEAAGGHADSAPLDGDPASPAPQPAR